jgi:hypothetical protein
MASLILDFDVGVEIFSLIITFLIAAFSFHAYTITKQKRHEYLAIAFLLISGGIFFNILFNSAVQFEDLGTSLLRTIPLPIFSSVALFASIALRLAGYLTIFLITENVESKKTVFLLFLLVPLVVWAAMDFYYIFHMINFIILSFVFIHFYRNYHTHSTTSSMLVMLSFGLLALSQIVFMLGVFDNVSSVFYNLGYIVRAISFGMLFAALVNIYRPRR